MRIGKAPSIGAADTDVTPVKEIFEKALVVARLTYRLADAQKKLLFFYSLPALDLFSEMQPAVIAVSRPFTVQIFPIFS